MTSLTEATPDIQLAISGAGGSGVVSLGQMILAAAGRCGLYGFMRKAFGPQIRGGESAVLIHLAGSPTRSVAACPDALLILDWHNHERFHEEILIGPNTHIYWDRAAGTPPEALAGHPHLSPLPLSDLASSLTADRINVTALAWAGCLLGLPETALSTALQKRSATLPDALLHTLLQGLSAAIAEFQSTTNPLLTLSALPDAPERWLLSGNEAMAYGVLQAGIRFVSAYPITPATDLLEWLAKPLDAAGGHLVQAEDELSAINMAIGASFAGVPSFTATSGPGLSLMVESMGLAIASETPLVIVNVQRGGPSTGIPTKSEQADLNLAVFGVHGDAPHVVIATLSVEDAIATGAWAVHCAESYQTLVIVLSDQYLGHSLTVIDPPAQQIAPAQRLTAVANQESYQRYLALANGISPMATPGTPGCLYTADGLSHTESGLPSASGEDHQQQLKKRREKLYPVAQSDYWAEVRGSGLTAILAWGSVGGIALQAWHHSAAVQNCRIIALRLLSPFPREQLSQALRGIERLLVVEQNEGGQLYHLLLSQLDISATTTSVARPGPRPFCIADFDALLTENPA